MNNTQSDVLTEPDLEARRLTQGWLDTVGREIWEMTEFWYKQDYHPWNYKGRYDG